MGHQSGFLLNDHRFLEAISCPLKLSFLLQDSELAEKPPVFRQKNKLRLRDAIALQFENCMQTSDSFAVAAKETEEWLHEPVVAICGAVIKTGNLITRIPVLVKNGDHLTIVQVHGKLRRQPGRTVLLHPERKRSTAVIALKAAYRAEIVNRCFPEASVDVSLYFPQKGFLATENGLNKFTKGQPEIGKAFEELFTKVDASDAMNSIRNRMPGTAVHSVFEGLSVKEAIRKIIDYNATGSYIVERHAGCVHCPFRKSKEETAGCWETFFPDTEIQEKELQVPDLLGNGNRALMQQGIYFQEEIEIKDGFHEFDLLERNGGPVITLQQRRDLQILRAKKKKKPLLWIKKSAERLWSLRFPLHFIDFEAATYAIPMRKGDRPYTPMCFQFSCHTLYEDGTVHHSEWLHSKPELNNLHTDFTEKLLEVPNIGLGTIMHYSPFEKQAIHRILGEFQRDKNSYQKEIDLLNIFLKGTDQPGYERFVDLSEYIKRYYYNSFMTNSLSLKETLESVLQLEQNYHFQIRKHEINSQMNVRNEFLEQLHPYQNVQANDLKIMDGSSAMHAWIAQKSGLLNEDDAKEIHRLLYAYCEIDSMAMLFLYKHILRHVNREPQEDTILF